MAQKTPEGTGMSLHTVRTADYKNCIVKNLQCPLHLRRKIHMPRSIQKRNIPHSGLLGKNRNSPRPLLGIRIEKGILMIHPPQLPDLPGHVEHRLR